MNDTAYQECMLLLCIAKVLGKFAINKSNISAFSYPYYTLELIL